MDSFILLFISLIKGILQTLSSCFITVFGFSISLGSIIVACLVLSFIVSIFWRGAKA